MREFLKGLELDKETIDTIMAEHGKLLTTSKEAAETYKTQLDDVQGKLKEFEGIDVADLQGQVKKLGEDLELAQGNYAAELKKVQRQGETKDFLSGYQFINDITRNHYATQIDTLLSDEASTGKSRKELLDSLTLGEDGKSKPNIFVETKPQGAPGAGGNPPPQGNPLETDLFLQGFKKG